MSNAVIVIYRLHGEFNIHFFGKCGYLIHTETISGKTEGDYRRRLPIPRDQIVSWKCQMISKTGKIDSGVE